VITDYATHAYVSDVYVLEEHQGRGLAQAMIAALKAHPELQSLHRWLLFTRDAHSLYARFGFAPLAHPERAMLLDFPDVHE
jgi:GNAT superfamily N-acetyltransferase